MIFNIIKKTRLRSKKNKYKISQKNFDKYKIEFNGFLNKANLNLKLFNLTDWKITFDHAKRRAGVCIYSTKELSFSVYFLRNSSTFDIKDTLLHEISHALVGPRQGHNKIWKQKAISIGCTGKIYHSLIFSTPKWKKYCPNNCWETYSFRRNRNLVCRFCDTKISYKKNYVSSNSTNVPDKSLG